VIPLALLATATAAAPVSAYAIVVGYNQSSRAGQAPLRFADDDAARTFELLGATRAKGYLLTAFDRDSQATFRELVAEAQPPTRAALEAAFADARRRIDLDRAAGRRTVLHFYYAGHGDIEDGQGYVNLVDGRLYRRDFLALLLDGTRADRTHVIIDACKAYHLVSGRGPGGVRVPTTQRFAGPERTPGVGYVLSTSSDNDAHEWSAFSGGVFSHEVRSALAGAADLDLDGSVDYEELAAFVAVANEGLRFPRFVPDVFIQPPPDDQRAPVLALGEAPVRRLELAEGEAGRITLFDERGLRYADLHKAGDLRLRLALLQPRRYDARFGERSFTIDRGEGTVRFSELEPAAEAPAPRGEVHRAFERLFDTPLSADVLRGYRLAIAQAPLLPEAAAPERDLTWPVVLLAGAAVALAGGATFAVLSGNARAEGAAAAQIDRPELITRADALAAGAGAAFGAGALAIAAGAYLLWE
jgi:hypothetical protein